MYSIDKLSPNHVYQTSIAYFHIQESEPSATSLLTDNRRIPFTGKKMNNFLDFDQWHRMIVNVRQNLIPQHLIMTYMMKCEIKYSCKENHSSSI